MVTVLKLGPADHGRPMALEEFLTSDYQQGHKYELIDGRLYVSPKPNLPENRVEEWLDTKLRLYTLKHPDIINYLSRGARVFIPGQRRSTCPEPDLAAYHDYPLHLPVRVVRPG